MDQQENSQGYLLVADLEGDRLGQSLKDAVTRAGLANVYYLTGGVPAYETYVTNSTVMRGPEDMMKT